MNWNWKKSSPWQHVLAAVASVALASAVRAVFFGGIGRNLPYVIFYPAVVLAAFYGGLLGGLLATALSAALCFFWIEQGFLSPVEMLAMAAFLFGCTMISLVCEMMLRARSRAQLAQEKAEATNQELHAEAVVRERTEVALRETSEYLDNLFNYANDPIIVWDPQFRITRFNRAFESLTGRRADEVIGQSLEILFPPAQVENSMALISKTTGGERWEAVEIAILHRGGSVRTVLWNSATVFATNGKTPVATIAQGHDITGRKQAERALAESESQFRAMFEQAAIGVAQIGLDGRWLRVNQRLCEIVGYTGEELLAKTFQDLTHPDDLEADVALVRQVLAGELPTYTLEKRYLRKDRTIVPVNLTVSLVRDPSGKPAHFISVIEDITERKRAETAVRESEERFRTLFETLIEGFCTIEMIFDADGKAVDYRFLEINPAFEKQTGLRNALGRLMRDLAPDHEAYWFETYGKVALTGEPMECEHEANALGRPYGYYHVCAYRVGGPGSRKVAILFNDITERKRAEATLRESEERFRTLVETAPEAIFIQTGGRFAYVNAAALRLFGATQPAELLGQPVAERFHPDFRAQVGERIRRLNEEHQAVGSADEVCLTLAGAAKDASVSAVPFSYQNQHGALVFARDITEQKQAGAALRASDGRMRLATEATGVGIWEWNILTNRIRWDAQMFRIYGVTPTPDGFVDYSTWSGSVLPEELARQEAILQETARRGGRNTREFHILRRDDGECRLIEAVETVRVNDRGQAEWVVGTNLDVTERRQAEEIIRQERDFSHAALDSLPGLFYLFDDQGRFLRVNKNFERISGYSAAELSRMTPVDLFDGPDQQRIAAAIQRARQTGEVTVEAAFLSKDKTRTPYYFTGKLFQFAQKACVMGMGIDITERKRAEEKIQQTMADLERSNKELEHFAYIASHDLQEPLRMVASYTQLLAHHFGDRLDDKAGKYIHYAVDGAVRMQTLINDLLTYSRVGRHGKPLERTDTHAVLGEAIRNLAVTIMENRAVITNAELPVVMADPSQLALVFQNLLANAIKFRRAELPRVHVSARRDGDAWLFAVEDNGIGIEAQYAERVFIIFQRLHTREEYPGTGIGLAVCKRIVERHGGKIWFESTPGKGTTFFFTVPK